MQWLRGHETTPSSLQLATTILLITISTFQFPYQNLCYPWFFSCWFFYAYFITNTAIKAIYSPNNIFTKQLIFLNFLILLQSIVFYDSIFVTFNRPFPSDLWPLNQSEAWCLYFHIKITVDLAHINSPLNNQEKVRSENLNFRKWC